VETCDEESERRRVAALAADRRRKRAWVGALLLSPLLGHLPAADQQRIEDETAFRAPLMTIVSAAPFFVLGVVSLISLLAGVAGGGSLVPIWAAVPGTYVLAESGARISVVVTQGRPVGSLGGGRSRRFATFSAAGATEPRDILRRSRDGDSPGRISG
jgi:hypothetical protein